MPTYTSNYNLVKPLETEFYDVNDQNSNMDIIDTNIKDVSNKIDNQLGDISNLNTLNKNSTVQAINEVNSRSIIGLGYNDVRGILRNPSYYYNEAVTNNIYEFKEFFTISDLGLNSAYGAFANIETKVPYRDLSGSSIKQVAYTDNGTLIRSSINETSWGSWAKELTTDTNGNLTQNFILNKNIPYIKLQTDRPNTSYEVRLNANAVSDYGLDFYRNEQLYHRVFSPTNVQYQDSSGNFFSIQSLKQDCSDAFDSFASAITAKGVPTASGANASTIINNINAIPTGKRTASGSVFVSSETFQFRSLGGTPYSTYFAYFANPLNVIPKYVRVTYSNASSSEETIFDSTRPQPFSNVMVSNFYSNGETNPGTVIGYDATNNITASFIRIPVKLVNLTYQWYIEE